MLLLKKVNPFVSNYDMLNETLKKNIERETKNKQTKKSKPPLQSFGDSCTN